MSIPCAMPDWQKPKKKGLVGRRSSRVREPLSLGCAGAAAPVIVSTVVLPKCEITERSRQRDRNREQGKGWGEGGAKY